MCVCVVNADHCVNFDVHMYSCCKTCYKHAHVRIGAIVHVLLVPYRYWSVAIFLYILVGFVFYLLVYNSMNLMMVPPLNSVNTIEG